MVIQLIRLILNFTSSQIENDETPGMQYPNENESEDRNKHNICNSSLYAKKILDDQITGGINSLHSKQREVFNVVHNGKTLWEILWA